MFQWIIVGIVLLLVIWRIAVGILRKRLNQDKGCGCGCDGCVLNEKCDSGNKGKI